MCQYKIFAFTAIKKGRIPELSVWSHPARQPRITSCRLGKTGDIPVSLLLSGWQECSGGHGCP